MDVRSGPLAPNGQKQTFDVLEHQQEIVGFICEDFAFVVPASDIGMQCGA